jgi:4-azaleucine resistance transporter AzlC
MQTQSNRTEFLRGVRDELPILLGVIPFGIIFGALAIHSGLSALSAQATSSMIFAGSAQFIAAQMIGSGASVIIILVVVFIVNLRHALYSASIAPFINHLKPFWKYLLAYLLTDEAYIVAITYYDRYGVSPNRHWYFFGAGITLWISWQASTAAGIFLGGQLGQNWPLSFALPLTFIGLVVPGLKDRPTVAAAVSAGLVGLLAASLPYKLGLLLAALIGIMTGLITERYQNR